MKACDIFCFVMIALTGQGFGDSLKYINGGWLKVSSRLDEKSFLALCCR
jgi:hypothetical protein